MTKSASDLSRELDALPERSRRDLREFLRISGEEDPRKGTAATALAQSIVLARHLGEHVRQ